MLYADKHSTAQISTISDGFCESVGYKSACISIETLIDFNGQMSNKVFFLRFDNAYNKLK